MVRKLSTTGTCTRGTIRNTGTERTFVGGGYEGVLGALIAGCLVSGGTWSADIVHKGVIGAISAGSLIG